MEKEQDEKPESHEDFPHEEETPPGNPIVGFLKIILAIGVFAVTMMSLAAVFTCSCEKMNDPACRPAWYCEYATSPFKSFQQLPYATVELWEGMLGTYLAIGFAALGVIFLAVGVYYWSLLFLGLAVISFCMRTIIPTYYRGLDTNVRASLENPCCYIAAFDTRGPAA